MGPDRKMSAHILCVYNSGDGKSDENIVQEYLPGILAHKGGSAAILSDNGTEFIKKILNEACNQLGIKRLFSNPFHSQGHEKVENDHDFLKWTLTKFLESKDLEWDKLLPLTYYCYNIFPSSNGTVSPFSLVFG